MTESRSAHCNLTEKIKHQWNIQRQHFRFRRAFFVKWQNLELHIVIWWKKVSTDWNIQTRHFRFRRAFITFKRVFKRFTIIFNKDSEFFLILKHRFSRKRKCWKSTQTATAFFFFLLHKRNEKKSLNDHVITKITSFKVHLLQSLMTLS